MYKQTWSAQTGPAAGESESGTFYATTIKKLNEHVIAKIVDEGDSEVTPSKDPVTKVKLIDIGDCDYREVLHVESFPKTKVLTADLSFLKDKYHPKYFSIVIIQHCGKLYFLGPKIPIENIKTKWF